MASAHEVVSMTSLAHADSKATILDEDPNVQYSNGRSSWQSIRDGLMLLLQLFIAVAVAVILWKVFVTEPNAANGSSAGIGQPTPTYKPVTNAPTPATPEPDVCMTPNCLRTAARLVENMNTNADPCEDFYEYACGGWLKNTVLPPEAGRISSFSAPSAFIVSAMRSLLEATNFESDVEAIQKARAFYKSCLNEVTLDLKGAQPLLDLLQELNGWPVLDDDWSDDNWDLLDTLVKLRMRGNSLLFSMYLTRDDKNSSNYILAFDQAGLGLSSEVYYLSDSYEGIRQAYLNYSVNIAAKLRQDGNRTVALQQMQDMLDFEIKLAEILTPPSERRDPEALYHKMTLADMSGYFDFPWMEFVNRVVGEAVGEEITATEDILVYAPEYLTSLGPLLQQTDNKTIANYIIWRMVRNRVSYMGSEFLAIRDEFNRVVFGTEPSARWTTCVGRTNSIMGTAVSRMYLLRYFEESSKDKAEVMIDYIHDAFLELLDENDWMDEETKVVAAEKADSMRRFVAYDDYIMDNVTRLNQEYEMLQFDEDEYFENYVHYLMASSNNTFSFLRKPVNKDTWITVPTVVNAFYSPSENSISFPAGILRSPFYDGDYPWYLNFGGIGAVIGHEITHGFDDSGRQFDKNGNLEQWWNQDITDSFKEKAQCMIDQYSNYVDPETGDLKLNVSGRLTAGENIADNGGLKQTFRGYKKWAAANGPEPMLPGLSLTPEQLLFVNFGQTWCAKANQQTAQRLLFTDNHSPGRFRVIGSLSNSRDFAEVFSCPPGSPMNPRLKCTVW
ncbi:neprilysin-like [Branchiostoma floridae x Branchiostoma belcheri]